jgi:heme/copper-type cytochrome/quinol oxidase subunit 2
MNAMKQALLAFLSLCLATCAGHQQSAVDAAGPQAGRIEGLWWFFFWILLAIFIIVLITH